MKHERSQELVLAGLYLSRCSQKTGGRTPPPPFELQTSSWDLAYASFFDALSEGRTFLQFRNTLKLTRDQFDSHVDSGRRGFWVGSEPKPLPQIEARVLDDWKARPDAELWLAVQPFADTGMGSIPPALLKDLEAELSEEATVKLGLEGKMKAVVSVQRERSPRLRAAALEIHGYACQVCEFDFGVAYGEWGRGFAEVHHVRMLGVAPVDGVETDPRRDLAVLCSNCHRMIHRKPRLALTLDELRAIVRKSRGSA